MPLRTPCISRIARTPVCRTKWRRMPVCYYSSITTDGPPWFQQLRAEMLQRDVSWLLEDITAQPEHRLIRTLSGFLPDEWCCSSTFKNPVLPVGHHLIWFNLTASSLELLPDGTDNFHSPSDPAWVRRMWAGGSVRLKPDKYYHRKSGFTIDTAIVGAERIKDVQLRGKENAAKIFVTIERRFARLDQLYESHRNAHQGSEKSNGPNVQRHFKQQLRGDEEWGDAILKEERNLVFFKERTVAEMDAIKAGQLAPVRYLDPPGKPDFSHTLTPSRALLFRYSALTFNAHLIHLDRDYARNVEGHRNLLVHGPLSLTLMLQAAAGYVRIHTEGKQVIESIEYRNLAPLYCDEQMKICGMEKKKSEDGSVFEVWIEGPTGGVAVKGTVRTVVKRPAGPESTIGQEDGKKKAIANRKPVTQGKPQGTSGRNKKHTSSETVQATSTVRCVAQGVQSTSAQQLGGKALTSGRLHKSESNRPVPELKEATQHPQPNLAASAVLSTLDSETLEHTSSIDGSSQLASEKPDAPSTQRFGQADRGDRRTRTRNYRFITLPNSPTPVRRVNVPPKPMKPTMLPRSRSIMRRRQPSRASIKPTPLLRKYDAKPYQYDVAQTVAKHSRFRREGARRIELLKIRARAQTTEERGGKLDRSRGSYW